jgi:hypothetical protein
MSTTTGVFISDPAAPGDRATGQLDILLSDLTTYRFVSQVSVTPALARRIIELNHANNRNLTDGRVDNYSRDMRLGQWRERTGQPLGVSTEGRILNGQHRMHAVVKSGMTLRFDICFGIDDEVMPVIDAHRPRTDRDVIRTAGGGDIGRVTPIIKHVAAWDSGSLKGPTGKVNATPMELRRLYLSDANLFEAAAARGLDCARRNVGTLAALGTAYYLIARLPGSKPSCDDFFDQLVSGIYTVSDPTTHAPYRLREKLITYRTLRLTRADMLALVMRAWNRYNTLGTDGRRIPVERLQAVRSVDGEGLTNANFPRPIPAITAE